MKIETIFTEVLKEQCPLIHNNRLNAILDVAQGLRDSQNLSLSAIGRNLSGTAKIKHKIKKVDRCLGNKHLYAEIHDLYAGLSFFIFEHIKYSKESPIVIDLCYLKDDRMVQMLSAQLCTKGMALPVYQDVFEEGELKGKTIEFLNRLKTIIPHDKKVIIIMDAGFHVEWFKEIEKHGWSWICRIRQGKDLKLPNSKEWVSVTNFMPVIGNKSQAYEAVLLTKKHQYPCTLITIRKDPKGRQQKISRNQASSKIANGTYAKAAKEPWILGTNLSLQDYKASDVVALYSKRMQIEEAFRAIKSHQFGLSARYVRTLDIHRWAVLMLLATIVLITYWVIGVIGHSQGMQKIFQPNTVKDKKLYSYFTLGKFIIEFNYLHSIQPSLDSLANIIAKELSLA